MLQINKKLKVMCAAAALTLALIPVGCGTNDGTNNNGVYDGTNGTNNNGVYDGSNNNNNIIDDTQSAINNGLGALESDVNGIDNGITNNNAATTATTTNNNARIGTTTTNR